MLQKRAEVSNALVALLEVLGTTTPHVENKLEWERIRNAVSALTPFLNNGEDRRVLDGILGILSQIFPDRENVREWATIREECHRLLTTNQNVETELMSLLLLLSRIKPDRENKLEWARIRAVSNSQIAILSQKFVTQ